MDSVSKALHRREVMGRKVYRLVRAIKNAYITRLYGPFPYAKSRKTGPLKLFVLGLSFALCVKYANAQSVAQTVSPPTTQIDLSVVNPSPGTPLGRYVVSFNVFNSSGSPQVTPMCLYVTGKGFGPAWDTTTWPTDTYLVEATLWLPPSTTNVKSNCLNLSGTPLANAMDYVNLP